MLFVPTASKDVVAMMQSLFFPALFIWFVNDQLFSLESVSMQHLGYSDNMVTGYNKQNFICHPFLWRAPFRARQYCVSFHRLQAEFRSSVA